MKIMLLISLYYLYKYLLNIGILVAYFFVCFKQSTLFEYKIHDIIPTIIIANVNPSSTVQKQFYRTGCWINNIVSTV